MKQELIDRFNLLQRWVFKMDP